MPDLLLSLLAFALGILAWRIGRRGKRIDNHPVCCKCRYDLSGLPQDSNRCSECGADIHAKRAVRVGNRQPRRWLVWSGFSMALLAVPAAGVTGYNWWKNFDPLPWLPLSWVEDRYMHGDLKAEQEIRSRLAHNKLSRKQATQLIKDMTAWQDNPALKIIWGFDPVSMSKGDLLRAGVDPAVLEEFQTHRFSMNTSWRKQIVAGTPLTVLIRFEIHQLFVRDFIEGIEVEHPKAHLSFDDGVLDLQTTEETPLNEDLYARNWVLMGTDAPELWRHAKNGIIQGELIAEMDLRYEKSHVRRSIPFSIQVSAPGTQNITAIHNPAMDAQFTAVLKVEGGITMEDGKIVLTTGHTGLGISIDTLPENAAFEVHFEQAGKKWSQGSATIGASEPSADYKFSPKLINDSSAKESPRYFINRPWGGGIVTWMSHPTDLRPDLPLELVLTSSPELAAKYSTFDHIWQGEIRIPVPIKSK